LFFACQKDVSFIGGPDTGFSVVAPDPIKATLQGNIVDENNLPATGVTITVGTKTAVTNATGYFRITDASLDKNTSMVVAEKNGYFKGYRLFSATSGTNQVMIKLIKRNLAGAVTASSGGTATLANGAKITLPANGIVVASSGNTYSGDVKVYASYIDPKASDIGKTVPGSFMANDKKGKRVALSSFGMLAVELESASGEKLQIKSGSAATLTTPIPSASLSSAPANISLWYLDEQIGIWKEEGSATKQGNNYVGDVKHFSFWNCSFPFNAFSLSLTLHNSNNVAVPYATVRITTKADADTGGVYSAYGHTDSLGQVKGLVPANKNLLLEVLDPCGQTVYSQNLSGLTQATDLGIITVTNAGRSVLTIQGTLVDCNNLAVKKGYALIDIGGSVFYAATDAAGKFETTYIACSGTPTTATVSGVDLTSQQQSAMNIITLTSPVTQAGVFTACGTSIEQYMNYTLDGTDYNISSATNDSTFAYVNNQSIYIMGGQRYPGTNNLNFTVDNALSTGTFPVTTLNINQYNSNQYTNVSLITPFNVVFTKYANAAGEFYEGTLSGKFTNGTSTTSHTISASFRIRRI